jgi:hypothetical protein
MAVARCREAGALALMGRHTEAERMATRALGQLRACSGVPEGFVVECEATPEGLRTATASGG